MKRKRVMIAAPKSGSGKTVTTCAFLAALKKSGWRAVSYKCGPDYIDPMFHETVIKVPAKNLDTFFTGEKKTRELFLHDICENDFAVLEGVMGLYDGLGGVLEEGSSYHLAKVTKTPIVLVVDAKGMGRSVVSLIAGFLSYDKEHLIRGVLLNRISKGYYEIVKPLIEREQKIPVLGFLPEIEALHFESRHLGLIKPDEVEGMKEKLRTAAEILEKNVSLKRIIEIAEGAEELDADERELHAGESDADERELHAGKSDADEPECDAETSPVIAVAKDEAFCFYYADNLRLLERYGAKIKFFSPLRDEALPGDCHALLLGGGYPELYAKALSENRKMRFAVKSAVECGMPVVAECGGFLYLHTTLTDREGICHELAGVIPASCFYTGKLVRFGYVEILEKQSIFLPEGERIRGHEFHYYDSTDNGADAAAVKPATGKTYPCVIENEVQWLGFPHLYYPSNPSFAKAFVEKAARYKKYRSVQFGACLKNEQIC